MRCSGGARQVVAALLVTPASAVLQASAPHLLRATFSSPRWRSTVARRCSLTLVSRATCHPSRPFLSSCARGLGGRALPRCVRHDLFVALVQLYHYAFLLLPQGPTPSWAEMQARCRKPLLVTSIIKKQNAKKFHSHRLFFEGWLPLQKKLMRVDPEFLFCRRGWHHLLPFILAMTTPYSVLSDSSQ